MNPMYDLALDGYGPPLEPPDGYYFLTNEQQTAQEAAEQENQSSMIEIETIPPIEISLEQEQKQGEPAGAQAVSWMNGDKIWELQQRLASFYQVEADHVEVRMEP